MNAVRAAGLWRKSSSVLAAMALAAGAAAAEVTEITVAVPGPGSAVSLPVELMAAIGADRAEGVRIRARYVDGGGVALKELMNRNADFSVLGLPAAMLLRTSDARVVALAAIDDLPLYVLTVRSGLKGKVNSVADLRGRVIGIHADSLAAKTTSHQLAGLVLRSAGVPLDSVRFVAAGQSWETQSAMLRSGAADAVMGDEPYASRMIAEGLAFSLVNLGRPEDARRIPGGGFLRATLIGRSDLIEQDPQRAEKMVRIVQRTLQWIADHTPEQVIAALKTADAEERKYRIQLLRQYPRQYSRDARFSSRQLRETEIFFRASNPDHPAARDFALESMLLDKWAGRKD